MPQGGARPRYKPTNIMKKCWCGTCKLCKNRVRKQVYYKKNRLEIIAKNLKRYYDKKTLRPNPTEKYKTQLDRIDNLALQSLRAEGYR